MTISAILVTSGLASGSMQSTVLCSRLSDYRGIATEQMVVKPDKPVLWNNPEWRRADRTDPKASFSLVCKPLHVRHEDLGCLVPGLHAGLPRAVQRSSGPSQRTPGRASVLGHEQSEISQIRPEEPFGKGCCLAYGAEPRSTQRLLSDPAGRCFSLQTRFLARRTFLIGMSSERCSRPEMSHSA